ncbi:MAG: hypothetical protein J6C46_05305 [Clostridia bacterium]|nr:hypothetical protein [Clostridia bacterium]
MTARVKKSILALVGIATVTLLLAQFVPVMPVRHALCVIGGVVAETVRKKIAAE